MFLQTIIWVICFTSFSKDAHASSPGIKDTCITRDPKLSYEKLDSNLIRVKKEASPKFVQQVRECGTGFLYQGDYSDHSFEMIVPLYFLRKGFPMVNSEVGFSENHFNFHFTDGDTVHQRSIDIFYDFEGVNKDFFLRNGNVSAKKVGNKTIYLYRNWQSKYCEGVFLENNVILYYCSVEQAYCQELEEAILSFKWKVER
jgi:hypothetical protein